MCAPEPEALGDDRRAAVGGDHERRGQSRGAPLPVDRLDAHRPPALDENVGDPHLLAKVDRERSNPIDERLVEQRALDRHRVLAVRPPVADRPVRATDDRAVGRGDPHAGERRGQPVHRLQHAQAVEHARRLRAQVLAADLRAGEARAVEELHREAVLGEQDRRGGAPGPRADDDDVSGPGRHAVTATSLP